MPLTDLIVFILTIFLLMRGSSRGFTKSFLNPFCIIFTSLLSITYYQVSNDMVTSLIIGVIGPIIMSIAIRLILNAFPKTFDLDIKPSFLSRLGGALLTLAWGWVFIIFACILLAVLPPMNDTLKNTQNDVSKSVFYNCVAKPLGANIFEILKKDVPSNSKSSSSNDGKTLADDPRFQKIMQDPDIQKDVAAHDYGKLMSDPKMIAFTSSIIRDPALLKEIMSVYNDQLSKKGNLPNESQISKNP